MSSFKELRNDASPNQYKHNIVEPLFEGAIDFDTQGGLVVLDSGQIAEVGSPQFVPEGADTGLQNGRIRPQPFWKTDSGIEWRGPDYDPKHSTIGLELEMLTMTDAGQWHRLSPDGKTLIYPDGSTEPAEAQGHACESLKTMHECGSEKPYPRGYGQFSEHSSRLKLMKHGWLESRGLVSPPVSIYPELVYPDDMTDHPYINMLMRPDVLPRFQEYGSVSSEQINIQFRSIESALFAINTYQLLQPVLNLVTAASAIRDGSFDTTLRRHYENNPGFEAAQTADSYQALETRVRQETPHRMDAFTGEEQDFYDQVPYDWRPIARANGSRSGGVISTSTPVSLAGFLREGDRQLRSGETFTIARTLGWHTDRLRPDKGVIEICNISHAGQHPDKIAAVEETVIKVIIALQEYYENPHTYKEAWAGIVPPPDSLNQPASRQAQIDAAHIDNIVAAYYGKGRMAYDTLGEERAFQEIYDVFFDFANCYSPEQIADESRVEIRATLQRPPITELFFDASSVLEYFYSKGSNMTAVEALRVANQVEPGYDVNDLLLLMHGCAEAALQRSLEADERSDDMALEQTA